MPKLMLTINQAVASDVKAKIAAALTTLTAEHLNRAPAVTMVNIHDNQSDWYINGELDNSDTASYDLIIQITGGSNSDEEKAVWLAASGKLLNEVLGS